MAANINE